MVDPMELGDREHRGGPAAHQDGAVTSNETEVAALHQRSGLG